jgi:glycosyltransferase involved in cell wall biosynthesis
MSECNGGNRVAPRNQNNEQTRNSTLSVIIPTLNEENYLPGLLNALARQTRCPEEIIVADAGSTDGTVSWAREHGALVVPGGRPGRGRNAGARIAAGDLLLFLDADVLPGPDFIEKSVDEFERRRLDIATALVMPLSDRVSDRVLHSAANSYFRIVRRLSPRAMGCCILMHRWIYSAVGGFNESLVLAEDHDFVRRAEDYGRYGILKSARIPLSVRRLDEERLAKLFLQYLWVEAYTLAGRPIYSTPFEYHFGEHDMPGESQPQSSRRDMLSWMNLRSDHLRGRLSANIHPGPFMRKMNQRLETVRHKIGDLVIKQ